MTWHSIIVWCSRILGCLIFYAAWFLFENEEGQIQDRITQWKDAIGRMKDSSMSKAAVLLTGIASLSGKLFDRMFGKHLFSIRAAVVSVCYSVASVSLLYWLMPPEKHRSYWAFGIFMLALLLGSAPGLFKLKGRQLWIWGLAITIPLAAWLTWHLDHSPPRPNGITTPIAILVFVEVFGVSFVCDILYIALTRWMLRKASQRATVLGIVVIVTLNCALGVALAFGPLIVGLAGGMTLMSRLHVSPTHPGLLVMLTAGLALVSMTNFIDVIACSVFLVIFVVVVCHHLAWPFLYRPLYALSRYEIVKNKKLLTGIACALLVGPDKDAIIWKWFIEQIVK